ncbi:hypothetical protein LSH36_373g02087 [Paralvinella palmiformis]|uniref:1-acyl-sn-glycerol-3-phosphate acyltransferase n=1 Tax=Paralvinella palmiformis TaxID=53620 RepID=A0AAD9JEK4_9ANNE|nr:hypothetical protein LSH36_373g02087 [Paralvinella palmiformis]
MAFGVYSLIICCVAVLVIYLWRSSQTFRFYTKYCYYYANMQLLAFLLVLPSLLTPGDPVNIRYFQVLANYTFKLIGITVEKRNTEELENLNKPAILLVNHQDTVDIISLMTVTPYRATFLAKKQILYWGYFGLTAWLNGFVFIDRLNPEKARGTMKRVVNIIQERKIKLWIFPEGTRNMKGDMLPFKKGAFHLAIQAQVPIYPLVLSSYRYFLDPDKKIFNKGKVIASCLPPFETKDLTSEDVNGLLDKVRSAMQAEFKKISMEMEERAEIAGNSLLVE